MTELSPDADAASARAEEQARQRKARREAKIKAGAGDRLNKITGLGGGIQRDPAPAPATTTTAATTASSATAAAAAGTAQTHHADPDEVDISEHFYQPQTTACVPPPGPSSTNPISDAQLRQMMLGLDQPTPPRSGTPSSSMPAPPPGMEDDPMMRMMMQMLGGDPSQNPFAGLGGGGLGGGGGMPFPPPTQGQGSGQGATATTPSRSASLFRLLHTLIALALGLYIAVYTPFTGSKLSRDRAAAAAAGSAEERERLAVAGSAATQNFFWAFATAEAVLLASRYVLADRGKSRLASGSGVLGLVVGFLPGGVRQKVELAMRYGEVLGRVRGDVLVCVFVLGAAAWWRG